MEVEVEVKAKRPGRDVPILRWVVFAMMGLVLFAISATAAAQSPSNEAPVVQRKVAARPRRTPREALNVGAILDQGITGKTRSASLPGRRPLPTTRR